MGFTISTLEMFGLPKGYLAGNGHHLDWEKKKDENKGKGKKKTNNKAKATGKVVQKVQLAQEARIRKKKSSLIGLI